MYNIQKWTQTASQLRFTAVASSAGCSITELCAGGQRYPASTEQHGHGAAAAGVACRAALVSAPYTRAAENPGLAHGFWHRFLFNRFLTFRVCVCVTCVCVCFSVLSVSVSLRCIQYCKVCYLVCFFFFPSPSWPHPPPKCPAPPGI